MSAEEDATVTEPLDLIRLSIEERIYVNHVRLSDVPELSEIVKQFTTKYGKDFATSAIELRPDSGVSRLLICFILVPLTVLDLTRYVDMISNPEVAYVLRKRQAPDIMNEMSEV
ncbi:hypothetical protein Bca52824_080809 [Brassica carinata]|uniref:Uncharacterized protein n=1 Tax=Brassica carinata TaxID=52824 RepID=A0A8X7PHH7_BRACI|nr:hypothetical protein Bca52824_080809 [Brassica carinata]